MPFDEASTTPEAMSFLQLQKLMQSAKLENELAETPADHRIDSQFDDWVESTQDLLKIIRKSSDSLAMNRNPQQLMALGSFQTHLYLSLQALKASRL